MCSRQRQTAIERNPSCGALRFEQRVSNLVIACTYGSSWITVRSLLYRLDQRDRSAATVGDCHRSADHAGVRVWRISVRNRKNCGCDRSGISMNA